jgi:hypothetical protein
LRTAHQNFHPRNLGHIAFKVLTHYIQACATTPDKACALRPPRDCDRSREQMRLAPRASHHLAALLYSISAVNARPNESFDPGGHLKNLSNEFSNMTK